MRAAGFFCLFVFFWSPTFAQEPEILQADRPVISVASDARTSKKLESLETIAEPLAAALREIKALQAKSELATSEDEKNEIQKEIDRVRLQVEQLRKNFQDIVGGSESAEFREEVAPSATFQERVLGILQPVLSVFEEATSQPRELEELRNQLALSKEQKRKSEIVLDRIERLIGESPDPALVRELRATRRLWSGRQAEANSDIEVLSLQIDERMKGQRSVWETVSSGFADFFKSRGLNLLIAVLVAVFGYIATRRLYKLVRRLNPIHKKNRNNLTSRLSDVLSIALSSLAAIFGILLVFYVQGDWLLLTLVVLFLLGIAWTGKTAIPPYLDQIRMILNLGAVREGERLIYEGLPWRVEKLGFYTILANPELQGGRLRIPIREIMSMISRPVAEREVWFPSEEDDWVLLSDETFGKSIVQTPEQVVLLQLGGSMKTYPTADFLEMVPENLSHGFRIAVTFGIDYAHQADATGRVPEILKHAVTTDLIGKFGRDAIRNIQVEFQSAAASSLDYTILADFDGSMAQKYNPLKRRIQKVCVDTCNAQNWTIPFTQVTVHQAEIAPSAESESAV